MGMQGSARRSGGGTGATPFQLNGGSGFWVGGSNYVARAAELLEGPGIKIYDPAARSGNPTIAAQEGIMELGTALIDGRGGIQPIGLKVGGVEAAELTEISFRLFSDFPTDMRGGVYTRSDNFNTVECEVISQLQHYDDWKGPMYTRTFALERMYRKLTGLWWVPSVASPIPLVFEVSVWGMPRWHPEAAGMQES